MKVFIADDDKILRMGLKLKIEKNTSHTVVGEAYNGDDTLKALQSNPVDLLITDIKMPGIDGVELVKRIKELGLKLKIVVLSGFDEYQFVRETLRYGAVDYLLKPVENKVLFDLLRRIENDLEDEYRNEQQIKMFHEKVSESIYILKEKFLLELIKENTPDAVMLERKLREFGITSAERMQIAVVGLDDLYKVKREIMNDSNVIKLDPIINKIDDILSHLLLSSKTLSTLYKTEIVLLFISENNDAGFEGEVLSTLELLGESLAKDSGFTTTVGLSTQFEDLDRTYIAYNQALMAYNRRFYDGKNRVQIYIREKCCYGSLDEQLVKEKVELLFELITAGFTKRVKKYVGELMDWMLEFNLEPSDFREMMLGIVSRMCTVAVEFNCAMQSLREEECDLYYLIKEVDTFTELKEYVSQAYMKIAEKINFSRQEKSNRIIDISKDYIQKHYHEEISLKTVADIVHLNPNYFSEFFKNELGTNFHTFVTETKINISKKLLIDPDKKVYEVGQMVGYNEPVSFNRAFKRVEGVSPAEYRRIILNK